MAKKVKAVVKIQLPAGQATPAPPVGTALGPHGINIMGFCKDYNARTASMAGSIIPVITNPPLARALHAGAEIGDEIPPEQFKAVAEIIGYILRLKGKLPGVAQRPAGSR